VIGPWLKVGSYIDSDLGDNGSIGSNLNLEDMGLFMKFELGAECTS
jgi:hypothetical protein